MNGIIQEMLTLLKDEACEYSVAMRTDLAAELPEVMADRVQLQQVFLNLMLNAIEAMKDSGGELKVKSHLQHGQLQFSVTDTGVGLPTEKTDQMFSAFLTTKSKGNGLGLAISRSIVESQGGLWAIANDGRVNVHWSHTLRLQIGKRVCKEGAVSQPVEADIGVSNVSEHPWLAAKRQEAGGHPHHRFAPDAVNPETREVGLLPNLLVSMSRCN